MTDHELQGMAHHILISQVLGEAMEGSVCVPGPRFLFGWLDAYSGNKPISLLPLGSLNV